uniref:MMGP10 n=1 Tax=uncultured organism TaxID=155900 RepID=G9HQ32_9ZZZZ|nr:MMGP10 [uncultured organism]
MPKGKKWTTSSSRSSSRAMNPTSASTGWARNNT